MDHARVTLRRMHVDTYRQPVVYMGRDCAACRSEGFEALSLVEIRANGRSVVATLNALTNGLLADGEAGLSEEAWRRLGCADGDVATVSHPAPLDSFSFVRGKIFGRRLDEAALDAIVRDVAAGRYPDVHIAAFLTACAGNHLDVGEMTALTKAMVAGGQRLTWGRTPVVDKHCVGGLPGNRTTPIVVGIAAAYGLLIPKTSSRAITSPAGTADVIDTFTRASLSTAEMRRVVEREGGCLAWGGGVGMSPVDDVLIGIEHPLDLDSEGQLVASVLSKKVAAGSTHVLMDIPVGPTAKVRTHEAATLLERDLVEVGRKVGLEVHTMITDGSQPVGRGIGPSLEAHDVLAVLRNEPGAPVDLRERAIAVAARVLELDPNVPGGQGLPLARAILDDGRAWRKVLAIATAQGGFWEPSVAPLKVPVPSPRAGLVTRIDNRRLAQAAKLAGAPGAPAAGVVLDRRVGDRVAEGEPLFTVHAEAPGELEYALDYVRSHPAFTVGEP